MKLKSIKGFLPNKKELSLTHDMPYTNFEKNGFNKAIDQIGEKDLPKMDREKLAKILWYDYWQDDEMIHSGDCVKECYSCYLCGCYRKADALIANQDELFECK